MWVQTEDDKDKYVQEYNQKEGILLNKEKINTNSEQLNQSCCSIHSGVDTRCKL